MNEKVRRKINEKIKIDEKWVKSKNWKVAEKKY